MGVKKILILLACFVMTAFLWQNCGSDSGGGSSNNDPIDGSGGNNTGSLESYEIACESVGGTYQGSCTRNNQCREIYASNLDINLAEQSCGGSEDVYSANPCPVENVVGDCRILNGYSSGERWLAITYFYSPDKEAADVQPACDNLASSSANTSNDVLSCVE